MSAAALAPAVPVPPAYPRRWAALAVLVLARVLDLFDVTVSSIAAPSIRADLGGSYGQLQWFGAAYTLTFGAGLITGGRLGDRFGRRTVLLVGVAGFTLSSVACGLAPGPAWLIGLRAVQGGFAAVTAPQQLGLIKSMFRPAEMSRAFGVLGPAMGLATVGAPILGGILVDADLFGLGWRSVFLVNLPVGLALLTGALLVLPGAQLPAPARMDRSGMVLLAAIAVLLILPLVQGRELDWPLWTFVAPAAAIPLLAVFAGHERRLHRRGGSPLVQPGLLRNRGFTAGLAVGAAFFASVQGLMLVLMIYLQLGQHRDALSAGLVLVPWSVGAAISSTWAGLHGVRRFGRRTLHGGLLLMAVSLAGLATALSAAGSATGAALGVTLFGAGLGMGAVLATYLSIVLYGVRITEVGSASGLLNTVQQLASSFGVAVLGTVLFALAGVAGAGNAPADAVRAAAGPTFWLATALLVVAFGLAFRLPREPVAAGR